MCRGLGWCCIYFLQCIFFLFCFGTKFYHLITSMVVAIKVAVPWLQILHKALALQTRWLGSQRKLPESDLSSEVT